MNGGKAGIGKRSRYYHSQLDTEMLEAGREYQELADAYVIFICDYDPFGKHLYRYTWEMICQEIPEVQLHDGSHTIILSTCGENEDEVPNALVKFLKFVGAGLDESTKDYEDEYVRRLQASVAHVKTNREMEARYMLWRELINEEREEAREEGRAEGRIEGHAEGLVEGRIKGCIELLLEMLSDLSGDLPETLKSCIEQEKDLNVLKDYMRLSRNAATIEAFWELIKDRK